MIDNIIILLLIIGSFLSGLYLAGKYYKKLLAEIEWLLKVTIADKGLGYIAPPANEPVAPISQAFMDHLRRNGRATTTLRSTHR